MGGQLTSWDTVIIGGGFYGCALAVFLRQNGYKAVILEASEDLMQRASYVNQARIHNGYHYPRSFITAWRSLVNFPRFTLEFRECVDNSFEKIYAIARRGSKVNAYQFKEFCRNIGAPIHPAPPPVKRLFNTALIEEVFTVREFAFNAAVLRDLMRDKLTRLDVPMRFQTEVHHIEQADGDTLNVTLSTGESIRTQAVFNCTYAQINTVLQNSGLPMLPMKHEITELALIEPPPELRELGITVMDGAFFSTMPFPAAGLHSLSHVRYTPHESWADLVNGYRNPYAYLAELDIQTHATYMIHDSQRYLPALSKARYVRSLYEVKTVLLKNETDDGRPILCREHYGLKNLYLVMGGKIDNIYDVLKYLQQFAQPIDQEMVEAPHDQS
ncbi:MAG: FAD-binding oxidoreductase [Anaerolinea sp.]|nr:FAD-binding oxidoreductase [Anaerolinea sp.]